LLALLFYDGIAKDSPALSVTTHSFTTIQEKTMRTMRNFFAASVVAFALSLSTIAGDMHTGAPQPEPTPAPAEGEMTAGVNGTIHTGDTEEAAAGDAVVAGALSLLQSVLSLL
jgi:hypothetical protein